MEFKQLPEGAYIGPEHTQPYHSPEIPGQGHHIFVKNGVVYPIWYTWDEKESVQRFFWGGEEDGQVSIEDALTGFDLWTTKAGSFTDPTTRIPIKIGRARLYFTPDGKGLFQYNTPNVWGRGSVELHPFEATPLQTPLNNGWFDPTLNGQGITLYEYPNGKCYGGLFTYRNSDPTPHHLKSAKIRKQRWLMFEGKLTNGNYFCPLHAFEGGRFLQFHDVSPTPDVGGMLITPEAGKLIVEYDFDAGDGTAGAGVWNMEPII
jgi:hypothetical protein